MSGTPRQPAGDQRAPACRGTGPRRAPVLHQAVRCPKYRTAGAREEATPVTRTVPALERAFDILELFLDEQELSAPDITAKLGLPRTTVHELMGTLTERSYLTTAGPRSHRYRLGIRAFQLGSAYAERLDLAREGQIVAEEIAQRCHETVHIG